MLTLVNTMPWAIFKLRKKIYCANLATNPAMDFPMIRQYCAITEQDKVRCGHSIG